MMGVGWVTTPPLSTIFKKRPCGTTVMPFASRIDKNAWYASSSVTGSGETTVAFTCRTLAP
jgi:hypothetical protein